MTVWWRKWRSLAPTICVVSSLLMSCGSGSTTRSCATSDDCVDDDACTAAERCEPSSRTCVSEPLDGDGDGYPPLVCGGTDCDDSRSGMRCDDAGRGPDAPEFCRQFRTRICARDRAAARIDDAQRDICLAQIASQCAAFVFPAGCAVTSASLELCYSALVDVTRLDTVCDGVTTCGIEECLASTLCGP